MFPPEFPQETSGPAFAALRRGRQCCSGGGACPELVERISRLPQSPAPAERGRASAASRAVAVREGGFTTSYLVFLGIILWRGCSDGVAGKTTVPKT